MSFKENCVWCVKKFLITLLSGMEKKIPHQPPVLCSRENNQIFKTSQSIVSQSVSILVVFVAVIEGEVHSLWVQCSLFYFSSLRAASLQIVLGCLSWLWKGVRSMLGALLALLSSGCLATSGPVTGAGQPVPGHLCTIQVQAPLVSPRSQSLVPGSRVSSPGSLLFLTSAPAHV